MIMCWLTAPHSLTLPYLHSLTLPHLGMGTPAVNECTLCGGYLVADNLCEVEFPACVNDLLKLPSSHIAYTNVVYLSGLDCE